MVKFTQCGSDPVVVVDSCPELTGTCNAPCNDDCGCNPVEVPCPQPFYTEAPAVLNSSCDPTYVPTFTTTLKVQEAWNIPACGLTAVVQFAYLQSLLIGSNLWNGNYGYFEVTAFDKATQQVTIKNNCVDGNAAPGTVVPKCAEFIVAPPACCTGGSGNDPLLFPYVAIDFTAPAASTCIQITVTSVNGLSVGKNVQIGSGTYRVSAISSSSLITICNDGAGITPGTSVIAKNGGGDYQYPIIQIDSSPCTATKVNQGTLLVCDAGIIAPATGLSVGSVWVLTDSTTGEGEYQVTGQPTFTCTALTQPVVTSIGIATYTLIVADSSFFTVADILQLGTRTDRFTVTSIPDSTHLVGTLDPVPSTVEFIPIGTSVCLIACCEDLQDQVGVIDTTLTSHQTQINARVLTSNANIFKLLEVPVSVSATISGGGTDTLISNTASIAVNNPAAVAHNMVIVISVNASVEGLIGGTNTDQMFIEFILELDEGSGYNVVARQTWLNFTKTDVGGDCTWWLQAVLIRLVVPAATDIFTVRARVGVGSNAGTASYAISSLLPAISIAGVSV